MSIRSNQEFFGELREWSERKLKILEGYLDPFVKVLGGQKTQPHVYYVDAFAGAGLYRNGEQGSAIRAAELALRYRNEGKPYRLKCINVEADNANFANLVANTANYGNLVLNLQGTFAENIDTILAEVAGSPSLFFLDPFGVKGIDWELVRQITNRGKATDLWIRFDYSAVRRLDGLYGKTDPGSQKSFNILCQTYGINEPENLHNLLGGPTPDDRKKKAVELYANRLSEEFRNARKKGFSAAYSIRSITAEDKYALIFATGHIRGAIIASELICSAEETYQREVEDFQANQPRQLSLFSREPTQEEIFQTKVSQLADSIWQVCNGERLQRPDIYARILPEWFGRIRSKHMTNALKKLQEDGHIHHVSGAFSKTTTFFTFRD